MISHTKLVSGQIQSTVRLKVAVALTELQPGSLPPCPLPGPQSAWPRSRFGPSAWLQPSAIAYEMPLTSSDFPSLL